MQQVLRCRNKESHKIKNGKGKILVVFDGNDIYAYCNDRGCKRWTKITVSIPGININFSNAAITQQVMPDNFKFEIGMDGDIESAPVCIKR